MLELLTIDADLVWGLLRALIAWMLVGPVAVLAFDTSCLRSNRRESAAWAAK